MERFAWRLRRQKSAKRRIIRTKPRAPRPMPILAPRERPPFEEDCEGAAVDVGVTIVSGRLTVTIEGVEAAEPDEKPDEIAVTGDVPTIPVLRVICRVFVMIELIDASAGDRAVVGDA